MRFSQPDPTGQGTKVIQKRVVRSKLPPLVVKVIFIVWLPGLIRVGQKVSLVIIAMTLSTANQLL